jgi:hypothetical protein
MKKNTWLIQHRWLLGGLLLACLALAIILTIWAIDAHQYQLALAHYKATYQPFAYRTISGRLVCVPLPFQPPVDTSGPGAWGWFGWTMRVLAIALPAALGVLLHWREHRQQYVRIHKQHLDHATNRLAEAIGENQELPEGVFDAYSKLRELE